MCLGGRQKPFPNPLKYGVRDLITSTVLRTCSGGCQLVFGIAEPSKVSGMFPARTGILYTAPAGSMSMRLDG